MNKFDGEKREKIEFTEKLLLCPLNFIFDKWYKVLFLPPYSPDLNPIEIFWANFKKMIQNNLEKFKTLAEAIDFSFSIVGESCMQKKIQTTIMLKLTALGAREVALQTGLVALNRQSMPILYQKDPMDISTWCSCRRSFKI